MNKKRWVFSMMALLAFGTVVSGQMYEETLPNPDNEHGPDPRLPPRRPAVRARQQAVRRGNHPRLRIQC